MSSKKFAVIQQALLANILIASSLLCSSLSGGQTIDATILNDNQTATTTTTTTTTTTSSWRQRPCESLQMGQYRCDEAAIDPHKQNEVNCSREGLVEVACRPARGIVCNGQSFDGLTVAFRARLPCRYVTTYHYKTAVLLSIFLGVFGIDRFYLGYAAIGVLKFCTCGFMLIGYLIDMILIITQTLRPIDGSHYIVDYYGQVLYPAPAYNNYTFNLSNY